MRTQTTQIQEIVKNSRQALQGEIDPITRKKQASDLKQQWNERGLDQLIIGCIKNELKDLKPQQWEELKDVLAIRLEVEKLCHEPMPWTTEQLQTIRSQSTVYIKYTEAKFHAEGKKLISSKDKNKTGQKLDEGAAKKTLTEITLYYNLWQLLKDLSSQRFTWKKLRRSIEIGEFQSIISIQESDKNATALPKLLLDYNTHQLIAAEHDNQLPAWQKQLIKPIALRLLENFRHTKVRTPELIAAIIPLAASQDTVIQSQVLEAFIKPIRDAVLIDAALVQGLAYVIRYVYALNNANKPKDISNLVSVLDIIFDRIAKLHHQKGDTLKIQQLLEALNTVLIAMLDQGVEGLNQEKTLEYSKQLIGLDTHDNLDIQFQVVYARQTLARLPSDTSQFQKYFGCAFKIVNNIVSLTKASLDKDPTAIIAALIDLKEAVKETWDNTQQDQKAAWYIHLRCAEKMIKADSKELKRLRTLVQTQFSSQLWLEYGILYKLTPVLIKNPLKAVSLQAAHLMIQLSMELSTFIKEVKVSRFTRLVSALQRKSDNNDSQALIKPTYSLEVQQKALQLLQLLKPSLVGSGSKIDVWYDVWHQAIIKGLNEIISSKQASKTRKFMAKLPLVSEWLNLTAEVGEVSDYDITQMPDVKARGHQLLLMAYKEVAFLDYRLEDLERQTFQFLATADIQQDLQYYVAPKAVTAAAELNLLLQGKQQGITLLNLEQQLISDLNEKKPSIILIQGHSGSGKTLIGQHLQRTLWLAYTDNQNTNQNQPIIFIWVPLGLLKDPTTRCVEQVLESMGWNEEEIQTLKQESFAKKRTVVIGLDSFNEVTTEKNLLKTNDLERWGCQIIINTRPLTGNYRALFKMATAANLTEYYVAPFQEEQIKQYFYQKFLQQQYDLANQTLTLSGSLVKELEQKAQEQATELLNQLQKLPGVKNLMESPFILSVLWDILPALNSSNTTKATTRLTLTFILNKFIERWYDREESNLRESHVNIPKGFLIRTSAQAFSEELAVEMQQHKQFIIPVSPNQYRKYRDVQSDSWKRFFNEELVATKIARQVALLKYTGTNAQFVHKLIQEYYVACAVYPEIHLEKIDTLNKDSLLNQVVLHDEPSILKFISEMIGEDYEKVSAIFKIVERAQSDSSCQKMVVNAVSLLSYFFNADNRYFDNLYKQDKLLPDIEKLLMQLSQQVSPENPAYVPLMTLQIRLANHYLFKNVKTEVARVLLQQCLQAFKNHWKIEFTQTVTQILQVLRSQRAIPGYQRLPTLYAQVLYNLGRTSFKDKKDLSLAGDYFRQAVALREAIDQDQEQPALEQREWNDYDSQQNPRSMDTAIFKRSGLCFWLSIQKTAESLQQAAESLNALIAEEKTIKLKQAFLHDAFHLKTCYNELAKVYEYQAELAQLPISDDNSLNQKSEVKNLSEQAKNYLIEAFGCIYRANGIDPTEFIATQLKDSKLFQSMQQRMEESRLGKEIVQLGRIFLKLEKRELAKECFQKVTTMERGKETFASGDAYEYLADLEPSQEKTYLEQSKNIRERVDSKNAEAIARVQRRLDRIELATNPNKQQSDETKSMVNNLNRFNFNFLDGGNATSNNNPDNGINPASPSTGGGPGFQ